MENKELEKQVIDLLGKAYRKETTNITRESIIAECLSPRSLEMMGFVSLVEKVLDVSIPLREATKIKTVGEIIDLIEQEL